MSICYPDDTDWSARFDDRTLDQMRQDPATQGRLEKAEAFAWSLLASLTLYRIGTCPLTVHPCASASVPSTGYLASPADGSLSLPSTVIGRPYISGGVWYNACGHHGGCSCRSLPSVLLPGPVGSIVSVRVHGSDLPQSAYRVEDGSRLVRTDGGLWPVTGGEEEFSVTYYRGAAPNIMTRAAAGALAVEFYENFSGNPCRLPSNVTNVSRGGESYELGGMDFPEGDTGIPEVDALVRMYNPNRLKVLPAVASPDSYRAKVTTWRR